jgi:hypothetical protein
MLTHLPIGKAITRKLVAAGAVEHQARQKRAGLLGDGPAGRYYGRPYAASGDRPGARAGCARWSAREVRRIVGRRCSTSSNASRSTRYCGTGVPS